MMREEIRLGKKKIKENNPSKNFICQLLGCKWKPRLGMPPVCERCGNIYKYY